MGLGAQWVYPFTPSSFLFDQPSGAIGLLGIDALRPQYAIEVPRTDTVLRLRSKWDFWSDQPRAGLVSEIEASTGTSGVVALVPGDFVSPPDLFDYWSRFWVQFPDGVSTVSGSAPTVGSFNFGDGTRLGPAGLTPEFYQTLKAVARRFKPVQWVAWDFEFILSGTTYRSMAHPRIDNAFLSES